MDRAGVCLARHYPADIPEFMGQPTGNLEHTNELERALEIVNNWRSSHNIPLNVIQSALRKHAQKVEKKALIAQRIKRLPSIAYKLRRFENMKLSRMQDIGGCRAIVDDITGVRKIEERFAKRSRMKHELERKKDYVSDPKLDGYRGIHLVYRYRSQSEKNRAFDGHQIEIQLRSRPQHVWATAVETVGTLIRQPLKSDMGEESWQRFFALMSSWIALNENAPPVPETPLSKKELLDELRQSAIDLQVGKKLVKYGLAFRTLQKHVPVSRGSYYLLEFNPGSGIHITSFRSRNLDEAMSRYLAAEKRISETKSGAEAVLVSVSTVKSLRAAYPSYFADTIEFTKMLEKALSGKDINAES